MNDTIDTLKIKVEGEGQSAVKTLDELITTLERVKGTTSSRSIGTLTSKLESLKSSINDIKTKNLSKLNAIFSTLSNANKINISPRLPERIRELGEAVDTLDGIDFSKLNEMASGLSALSRVGHVNLPRVNGGSNGDNADSVTSDLEGTEEVASRVVSEDSLSRMDRFSSKLSEIKDKIKSVSSKAGTVKSAIKEAFSTSILGKFASKLKETITSLGRIAMYRIMRSLIKQVTEAFSTGINDMYQYSKTFNGNFAQSMDRLASANLTFKNSIGAIMAPLIEFVTPWLDSLLTKLTEVNNAIAMVFAHLAGKSTYSKAVRVTTEYAEAANKASENTGKVTEKVEKLKRSLAGLDEITIIGNKDTSPISSKIENPTVDKGTDYGSMFVETPVNTAKVKEILDTLNDIWNVAKWIGIAIAAWKLATFISSIGEALTGIGLLKSQLVGITLMVVGFSLEFSGARAIGYGNAGVWDYIKTALGAALGIAGSLLVFGTGPLGWTIGITAAIVIAVAGITVGMEQRLSDVVEEAFYGAGGVITISDLADQFERYMKAIQLSHQPTIDLGKEIDNLVDKKIAPSINTIRNLGNAIEYDSSCAKTYLPKIQKEFSALYDNSTEVLNKTHDLVIQSLAGGFGETLKALGMDVPELVALVNGTTTEIQKSMDDLNTKFDTLQEKKEKGKISSEQYNKSLGELLDEFAKINGIVDPVTESFDGVQDSLSRMNIDWENKKSKDLAFAKIAESATTAQTAVEESYKTLKTKLEYYARNAETKDARMKYEEMIAGSKAYRDEQLKKIGTATTKIYDWCQDDMISKMKDVSEKVGQEYKNSGWFTQLVATREDYIREGLAKYKKETIEPITQEMDSLYGQLGLKGKTYAKEAAREVIKGLFEFSGNGVHVKYTGNTFEQSVYDAYDKIGKKVPDGLYAGINSKSDRPLGAIEQMTKKIKDTVEGKNGFDINSPSKVFEDYGKYLDEGFTNGISRNQPRVITSLENLLNTMICRLETFLNRWRSAINSMFDDMAYGWKNADFRNDGSYSYKYLQQRNIQRFAQGGFPEDGLFYANHNELVGQFSNGKTAVANNEQIVEGIAGGVAAANEQQNTLLREQNKLLRMLLEKDSTIDVSTIASAFNRKNQRDGKVTVPVSI